MAQTTINFAIKDTANIPEAGGNTSTDTGGSGIEKTSAGSEIVKASASEETTTSKNVGSANTGFLTQETNKIIESESAPFIFGGVFLVGLILLFAFVAKLKKRKNLGFKKSLNENRRATAALGFLSLLMIFAGIGGTASKFLGSSAASEALSDITTSVTVDAERNDKYSGNGYNLYCATDQITPNGVSDYGYQLYMYAEDGGDLPASTLGYKDIASVKDWDGLGIGEWGYFLGGEYTEDVVKNPLPQGLAVLDNKNGETTADSIPVTFCAKISENIKEATFSTKINYAILPKFSDNDQIEIDYNSVEDDDGDGISNREENRLGLDPASADTDLDGLTDDEEIRIGTNPLSKDTDGDGLTDYSEVMLGAADGISADASISHTYTEKISENLSFTVTGTGNIPLTYVEAVEPSEIADALTSEGAEDQEVAEGYIENIRNLPGKAYIFKSAGEVDNASITTTVVAESETADCEDECVGATENKELYGTKLTFDDSNVVFAAPATVTEGENNRITMPVSGDFSIILTGDKSTIDDDELVGSTLIDPSTTIFSLMAIAAIGHLADVAQNADWSSLMSNLASGIRDFFSRKPNITSETKAEFLSMMKDITVQWIQLIGGWGMQLKANCQEAGYSTCGQMFAANISEILYQLSGTRATTSETQSIATQLNNAASSSSLSITSKVNSANVSSAQTVAKNLNNKKNSSGTKYDIVDRADNKTVGTVKNNSSFKSASIRGVGPTAFINAIKAKIKNNGVAFVTLKNNSKSGFGVTSIASTSKSILGITTYKFEGYDMTKSTNSKTTWTVTCTKTSCKNGLQNLMLMTTN